jgi:hypothetical protein
MKTMATNSDEPFPQNHGSNFWEAVARRCLDLESSAALKNDERVGFIAGFMHGVTQARRMQLDASELGPDALTCILDLMKQADEVWQLDGYFDLKPSFDIARLILRKAHE